jgi:NADPH:quinone reductase-like Zn-dependent oxidoreductase
MDVVFDTAGGGTLKRSWNVLKQQGRMVTIAASEEAVADQRVKNAFLIVEPNRRQLTEIAGLLDAYRLLPFVAAAVPLSQAPMAYAGTVRKLGAGKVVVVVATGEGFAPAH